MDEPITADDPVLILLGQLKNVVVPLSSSAPDALRKSVWVYVDDLKARGWPPERVIVAVKKIAYGVGLRPSSQVFLHDPKPDHTDKLLVEMVGW